MGDEAGKGKSPKAGKEAASGQSPAGSFAALHKATCSHELQWQLMYYRMRPQTTLSQSAPAPAVSSPGASAGAAGSKSPKAAAAQGGKAAPRAVAGSGGFPTVWAPLSQQLPPGHTAKSFGQETSGLKADFRTVWAPAAQQIPPGHTDFSWTQVAATGSTSKPAGKKAEKPAKAAAKPATAAAAAGAGVSETVDVSWGDIRVGHILEAKAHPESDKLCVETIDVGEDQPRQILSGILHNMKIEDVKGKDVVVICNLKARKLAGMESAGMVLCAHDADRKELAFVVPPKGSKPGERLTFDGFPGDAASVKQMDKKKAWEAIAPELVTNSEGVACYKKVPFTVSGGVCKAPVKDGIVS